MTEEWRAVRLGEVCTLLNGRAYNQNELLQEGKYPVLRVGNFFSNKSWYYSNLELDPTKYCDDGDLLYAWSASFGPKIWVGGKVIYHYHIWKAEIDKNRLIKKFLYYWFDWDSEKIKSDQGAGTTMTHVTKGSMENRGLMLPPLTEQKRIAAILDEAYEGIDTAVANTKRNLANARELFDNYLRAIFANNASFVASAPKEHPDQTRHFDIAAVDASFGTEVTTRTGGRAATTRQIPGNFSLSVGMPKFVARKGWRWLALTDLARMESGHTPSRRHPEYWGGDVPWVGIRDAKRFHGAVITKTEENTNDLGIANSSARLLPSGTVCLSRTASVGYVTVLGRSMATSQDFVNWVCSTELNPHFLKYLLISQGDEIFKFSSGAVHQTIYFPEAKAFHICVPELGQQASIITLLDSLKERSQQLEAIYRQKLATLSELKQSILHKAFAGELTSQPEKALPEAAE